ncbi:CU044_5270 family protein [Cellulomonas hominis]
MNGDEEREVDQLRALMREHGLLPPVPAPLAADPGRGEELRRRILDSRRTDRRLHGRSRWLAAAAVIVVVVIVGYGVLHSAPPAMAGTPRGLTYSMAGPDELSGAVSADGALLAAARVAGGGAGTSRPGTVQFVATYGWLLDVSDDADPSVYPTLTERWLAQDGSGRVEQTRSPALGLDGRLASGDRPIEGGADASDVFPAGTFDATMTAGLPLDPEHLRTALLSTVDCAPSDPDARGAAECLVHAIERLYASHVVPGDLAAAIWTVLAGEVDVKDMGTTHDRLGRPVWAVGLASAPGDPQQVTTVLLVSQETGGLVATETVTLRDETLAVDRATVTAFQTWQTAAWVQAVGDHPAG